MFFVAMMALAVVPATAFASAHGGAPAGASLFGLMLFEIEHFFMHMGFTFDAIVLMLSGQFAAGMLELDLLANTCAQLSPMVGVLFGHPLLALATFFATLAIAAYTTYQLLKLFVLYQPRMRAA